MFNLVNGIFQFEFKENSDSDKETGGSLDTYLDVDSREIPSVLR